MQALDFQSPVLRQSIGYHEITALPDIPDLKSVEAPGIFSDQDSVDVEAPNMEIGYPPMQQQSIGYPEITALHRPIERCLSLLQDPESD